MHVARPYDPLNEYLFLNKMAEISGVLRIFFVAICKYRVDRKEIIMAT